MRKQYHFHKSGKDIFIWDVSNLISLSKEITVKNINLENIKELEENYWFGNSKASCKAVAEHTKLINECNLNYPIILSSNGRVMDGMHRVCKAYIQGKESIKAVQFSIDSEPDFINVDENDLTYD